MSREKSDHEESLSSLYIMAYNALIARLNHDDPEVAIKAAETILKNPPIINRGDLSPYVVDISGSNGPLSHDERE